MPDLVILAKWLAPVYAGFVNARFLIFSPSCFAASVSVAIWQYQIYARFLIFSAKFDSARFGNSSKFTCCCEYWICQCQIFDIFNKMFCHQCNCQNLALPDLVIPAMWLATMYVGFVNAGFLIFSLSVLLPVWLPQFWNARFLVFSWKVFCATVTARFMLFWWRCFAASVIGIIWQWVQ